ncbi:MULTISPECIES: gamma-glutamylcyclotransferase family protein [Streptomyces]|uniref:Gamma-glutamylcyclotransferase n=1 Tax=Streptomyces sudanensis TaxID=436397 RepID=A0ABY4TCL0_9ACTN|nr:MULTISPECIES: gamma-glutamylcyclotransferase family protein [Streptomyces]MCP9959112.1 gamma-glutamylcyclotransferase [Streptomyces sudanensis]MCQ0000424.1 gamma-glutamylcyclotransferase [Streptomyces sudanensis]URN15988.1 gamma-glutamylcyclotransferase [Streptomyces sudanensis]
MTAGELPFFVYGTLRPGERNHALLLRGRTAAAEPARLPGAALHDGPGYPYAVRGGTGEVAGELVRAAPGAYGGLLSALDRLEEYHGPGHPLNLYERRRCDVVRQRDGALVPAWVYVAAARAVPGPRIPGDDWLGRRPPRGA